MVAHNKTDHLRKAEMKQLIIRFRKIQVIEKPLCSAILLLLIIISIVNCSEPEKSPPAITGTIPTEEEVGGEVLILGKNFATATTVTFGNVTSGIVSKTDTEILTVVPPGVSVGNTEITVTSDAGTSSGQAFKVLESTPVDPATQPVIDEVVAAKNITEQLMLIRGKNLSTSTKVKFGVYEADVLTATSKVVTAIIPATLKPASYSVKVKSSKGTSEGKPFEVIATQPNAPAGVTLVNGAIVVAPPSGYIPPIQNLWENASSESETVFLNDETGGAEESGPLSAQMPDAPFPDEPNGFFDRTVVDGVMTNYIEFTGQGIRYVGTWSTTTDYNANNDDCYHNLVLISTQSGKQLKLRVRSGSCQ